VRNRVQELRLQIVGSAQHLSLRRFLAEPRALDGETELRGGDREEPFVRRSQLGRASAREDSERADPLARRHDRDDAGALVARGSRHPRSDQAYSP